MNFQLLIAIGLIAWLASLAACAIAVFVKRLSTSLILNGTAFAIGYLGLTRFHLSASKKVNGHVQWSFDSKWFFIATLVLAALTLAYTIWKHNKTTQKA